MVTAVGSGPFRRTRVEVNVVAVDKQVASRSWGKARCLTINAQ